MIGIRAIFSCGDCGHVWQSGGKCPCPTHPKPCPDRFPNGVIENVRLPFERVGKGAHRWLMTFDRSVNYATRGCSGSSTGWCSIREATRSQSCKRNTARPEEPLPEMPRGWRGVLFFWVPYGLTLLILVAALVGLVWLLIWDFRR